MNPVSIEQHDDLTLARLPADVDLANAFELGEHLATGVSAGSRALVLDLSATRYMDSAGLDMLMRLDDRLRKGRRQLRLVVSPDSPLERLLEIVPLPPMIAIHPDLKSAEAGS